MHSQSKPNRKILFDIFLCLLTGVLLSLAFPIYNLTFLAWIGLVPFLFALDGKTVKGVFFLGWFCGFVFFLGTMYWFLYLITWFGWIVLLGILILLLYLGLYFAVFGWFYKYCEKENIVWRGVFLSAGWVVLDFLRGHLLTGFDWASLGYSQQRNLLLIQIADVTGVFGISFLIVLVNVFIKEVLKTILNQKYRQEVQENRSLSILGLVAALCLAGFIGYGILKLEHSAKPMGQLKVAIVQGNISQAEKWTQLLWSQILSNHISLTEKAIMSKPDLIIWPETSFPGIAEEDEALWNQLIKFVKKIHTPLLVGTIEKDGEQYYNSAFLFNADGTLVEKYRKIHLVPFGEFFPFRSILSPIAQMLDIGDFSRGDEFTLFKSLKNNGFPFSVLICFEDTVAHLARRFASKGSGLFINMTNDAWFGDTQAAVLHMQNAVFRSVENRRSLIRSANTGVSCFIDSHGRIKQGVQDQNRKATFIDGISVGIVEFHNQKTFYTKYGDVFAYLCFGCILCSFLTKGYLWNRKKYS